MCQTGWSRDLWLPPRGPHADGAFAGSPPAPVRPVMTCVTGGPAGMSSGRGRSSTDQSSRRGHGHVDLGTSFSPRHANARRAAASASSPRAVVSRASSRTWSSWSRRRRTRRRRRATTGQRRSAARLPISSSVRASDRCCRGQVDRARRRRTPPARTETTPSPPMVALRLLAGASESPVSCHWRGSYHLPRRQHRMTGYRRCALIIHACISRGPTTLMRRSSVTGSSAKQSSAP